MKLNTIKVKKPTDIKSPFYESTVKELKSVLKLSSFNFMSAIVTDEYRENGQIVVVTNIGTLITHGCEDGMPWIEAYNTPKLFEKMAKIGFYPSFFKVEPLEKKDKRFKEIPQALNIGFTKKVPKNEVIK